MNGGRQTVGKMSSWDVVNDCNVDGHRGPKTDGGVTHWHRRNRLRPEIIGER